MGHSYTSVFVHCVFSTKDRRKTISPAIQERFWAYLIGTASSYGIEALATGGMADHIHMLLALPSTKSVAEAIQKLKANSSRWVREHGTNFAWQEGYGAFSVSPSQVETVKTYIRNQPEHHKKRSFEQEFLALLKKKAGVKYDARFVFG